MKSVLLLLLALLLKLSVSTPPKVRVTFSPLTKAAYLAAKKVAVVTKPKATFPLKKQNGRIVIPTAKGSVVFKDNDVDEENPDWEKYTYLGYWPQFECYLILHNHYEWSRNILLSKGGQELMLHDDPRFSPDLKSFVAISAGIEYWAFDNSIRLFRFENHRWREVWKLEPSVDPATWEPTDICWLANSTLLLKKKIWTGKSPGNTFTYSKLTIK